MGDLDLKVIKDILEKSFDHTSKELSKQTFDVGFSGSTAVTLIIYDDLIICANVGDSRAIMYVQD